jgi:hypothetical protein
METHMANKGRQAFNNLVKAKAKQAKTAKAKNTAAQAPAARQQAATPALAAVQPATAQRATKPTKTAPVPREERNGVKRPGPGKCLEVWDYLDKHGNMDAKDLKPVAEAQGWNRNNALIELYGWRKFNGLGRFERAAVDPKPVNKKEVKAKRATNEAQEQQGEQTETAKDVAQ